MNYIKFSDCKNKAADVIFVMDMSGSVGSSNFQKMKSSVASSVNMMDVAPNSVHIGVIRCAI